MPAPKPNRLEEQSLELWLGFESGVFQIDDQSLGKFRVAFGGKPHLVIIIVHDILSIHFDILLVGLRHFSVSDFTQC